LSFPVTHFHKDGAFNEAAYRAHVAYMASYAPAALFAAGGTGEFFSLGLDEYPAIIRAAVEAVPDSIPVIAGVGYGTRLAIAFAQAAEAAGAHGLLVLPHYLVEADQEGLYRHMKAICDAVRIGVIVYNRGASVLTAETLVRLSAACPNLIGFKDGVGNMESVTSIRHTLRDRLVYVGGMPTAEVFARASKAVGITTYSSAVFNFMPEAALRFYRALQADDDATLDQMLERFFLPFLAIRNRRPGYAVSIVKSGLRLLGRDPGPVRTPLLDLTIQDERDLGALLEAVLPALAV
jgi:5-dehydro-4-deoxyglucarate dehydratase